MRRQDFFEHIAWTGSSILWSLSTAGTLVADADATERSSFSFVRISDSHIGFTRPENPDVRGTHAKTIDGINALPQQPAVVMHTGDVTHLSKPAQIDDAKSVLGTLRVPLLTVAGEHDVIGGTDSFAAFGRPVNPHGWFAFDQGGIHFLSLVNVFDFEIDGKLGEEQPAFVERDLAAQKRSTPSPSAAIVASARPSSALHAAQSRACASMAARSRGSSAARAKRAAWSPMCYRATGTGG